MVEADDKPLSFMKSVVDSHSSPFVQSKTPAQFTLRGRFVWMSWSWPISRVLSWTVIHLGQQSLTGSSSLPGFSTGRTLWTPIWPCSGWSLPCRELLPDARCALTAPFHPYLIPLARAIGGLLSVALVVGYPPRRYLAPCPMEPGLSSPPPVSPRKRTTTKRRLSGQLRREV